MSTNTPVRVPGTVVAKLYLMDIYKEIFLGRLAVTVALDEDGRVKGWAAPRPLTVQERVELLKKVQEAWESFGDEEDCCGFAGSNRCCENYKDDDRCVERNDNE